METKTTLKDFGEIERQKGELKFYRINSFIDCLCDYDGSTYISDAICEIADNHVDVCNRELLNWLSCGDNWQLVDDAIKEFGKSESIIKDIQIAQFMDLERAMYEEYDAGVQLWVMKYILDNCIEFTPDAYDQLLNDVRDYDGCFDALIDLIYEASENERYDD